MDISPAEKFSTFKVVLDESKYPEGMKISQLFSLYFHTNSGITIHGLDKADPLANLRKDFAEAMNKKMNWANVATAQRRPDGTYVSDVLEGHWQGYKMAKGF